MAQIANNSSPIADLQSLYNMINGQQVSGGSTTVQAGGTTVNGGSSSNSFESSSTVVSKEAMDAMMKSALESSTGLASVSSGQRAAGGYNSSVNSLLTNDLLTRIAGQIAQGNKTSTKTTSGGTGGSTTTTGDRVTTTTPTTSGGLTGGGVAKTATFLAALQAMSKLGGDGSFLKKLLGAPGTGGAAGDVNDIPSVNAEFNGSSPQTALAEASGNPNSYSQSISNMVTDTSEGGGNRDINNISAYSAGMDSEVLDQFSSSPTLDFSSNDFSSLEGIGIDSGSISSGGAMQEDPLQFLEDFGFSGMADGGEVSTKKSAVLGSSQFADAIDPNTGYTLGAGSVNPNPITYQAKAPISTPVPTTTKTKDPASPTTSGESSGGGLSGLGSAVSNVGHNIGGFGGEGAALSGDFNLRDFGSLTSLVGALSGDRGISNLGTGLSIAGSSNPVLAAGMTAANIATKGVAGTLAKAVMNPTPATAVDIGISLASPGLGIVNTILGMADLNSIGTAASNAATSLSVEGPTSVTDAFSPMTQAIQTQQADAAANFNQTDPMDAVMNAISSEHSGSQHSFGSFGDRGPGGSSGAMGDTGGSVGNDGLAGGGQVSAPGDGTVDTKLVPLANKEYVLPADVTEMIGVDKLDELVKRYHTPVAVQRLQNFARG